MNDFLYSGDGGNNGGQDKAKYTLEDLNGTSGGSSQPGAGLWVSLAKSAVSGNPADSGMTEKLAKFAEMKKQQQAHFKNKSALMMGGMG